MKLSLLYVGGGSLSFQVTKLPIAYHQIAYIFPSAAVNSETTRVDI